MSSLVIKSHRKDDLLVEYEWDKYAPHFIVYVLKDIPLSQITPHSATCTTLYKNRYATRESAEHSYRLQVKKVKGGYYE